MHRIPAVALMVTVVVMAGGCNGASSKTFSEADIVHAAGLEKNAEGEWASPSGCLVGILLNTKQEVQLYGEDRWVVTNPGRTAGLKFQGVQGVADAPCLAELKKALSKLD